MRNVLNKVVEKIKTHILCSITFSDNRTVYEIMSKTIVETEKPQMTSQYGAYVLRAGLPHAHAHAHAPGYPHAHMHARASMHTHRPTSNCFSTATMVS